LPKRLIPVVQVVQVAPQQYREQAHYMVVVVVRRKTTQPQTVVQEHRAQ
jgi:hypothetical protein